MRAEQNNFTNFAVSKIYGIVVYYSALNFTCKAAP